MSSDDKSVFDKMDVSMMEVVNSVRRVHGEFVVGGLALGLHNPQMGWALMGLVVALPTIVILKHPEWLRQFKDEKVEHLLLLMLLIAASNMYSMHCFANSLGFNWPS